VIFATDLRAPEGPLVRADGSRLALDGQCKVVAAGCRREPFPYPNDVCFGSDRAIYLIDSGDVIDHFAPDTRIRLKYLDLGCDGLPLCDGRKKGGQ
jgi:hypothetical protein